MINFNFKDKFKINNIEFLLLIGMYVITYICYYNFNHNIYISFLYSFTTPLIYLTIKFLIIPHLLLEIDNIFKEEYFFSLEKNNNSHNTFTSFKDFLNKKNQVLFTNNEKLLMIIFYPGYIENKSEIAKELRNHFKILSMFSLKKNSNKNILIKNILIINIFVFIIIGINIICNILFKIDANYAKLIELITFIIISSLYFSFLQKFNEEFNPSKINAIYFNLKKDLTINIEKLTISIISYPSLNEKKLPLKTLITNLSKQINNNYIKTLELTIQLLLAVSFIGTITIYAGLI